MPGRAKACNVLRKTALNRTEHVLHDVLEERCVGDHVWDRGNSIQRNWINPHVEEPTPHYPKGQLETYGVQRQQAVENTQDQRVCRQSTRTYTRQRHYVV